MGIFIIRPLSIKTKADYFRLFDIVLHEDNPHSACYCTCWNMAKEDIVRKMEEPIKQGTKRMEEVTREAAEHLIDFGILKGYLAYIDNEPVGWCNANDKTSYCQGVYGRSVFGETKSIVCFEIAESCRNRGIASALLEYVIEEAKQEGYNCVEGYTSKGRCLCEKDREYLAKMYDKAGFIPRRCEDESIVWTKSIM